MKKNLILFCIFVGLLAATYHFQEKRSNQEYLEAQNRGRVITGDITSIGLPGFTAQKEEGKWRSGEELLSHNSFRAMERRLRELKQLRSVEGERSRFFSDPVDFSVNGTAYSLGDLSLDRQSFYLARGDEIMLAFIDGGSSEYTTSEEDLAVTKYAELRSTLTRSLEEQKEKQLFRFYSSFPLERVEVSAQGHPAFELDLRNDTTLPAPLPGVRVHDKLREKFLSLLTQITIKEAVPFDEAGAGKKIASISFFGKESLIWEVHLNDKQNANAYLVDPQSRKSWLMVGGTLKVFFGSVQDYWDKKVIPPSAFENFDRLSVRLSQGSKGGILTVLNREPLGFESPDHRVSEENAQRLFRYVFNLGHLDQAQRVSPLSSTDRQIILNQEPLRLEVMGQELLFSPRKAELIVVNLTQGFKAHFMGEEENNHPRFEDVLK